MLITHRLCEWLLGYWDRARMSGLQLALHVYFSDMGNTVKFARHLNEVLLM